MVGGGAAVLIGIHIGSCRLRMLIGASAGRSSFEPKCIHSGQLIRKSHLISNLNIMTRRAAR